MPQSVAVDGEKIERLRKGAHLSRPELASLVGMSSVGVWKVERKGRTTLGTLRALGEALMVHPSELMERPEDYAVLKARPRDRAALANALLKREGSHDRSPAIR